MTATITTQVIDFLEHETLLSLEDVDLTGDIDETLGIELETDHQRIIHKLYQTFDLSEETLELLEDAQSIKELIDIVTEEKELS